MSIIWWKRGAAAVATALCIVAPASGQTFTDAEFQRILANAQTKGDPVLMDALGRLYLDEGPRHNEAEGRRWLQAAADKGHAPAALRLSIVGQARGAFDRAYLSKAVEGGLVQAMVFMGLSYARQAEPDYPLAARYHRQAADRGSAEGTYRLAALYSMGLGVPADAVESDRLMRVAAALDDPSAKRWLADPTVRYGDFKPEDAAAATALAEAALAKRRGMGFVNATIADDARVRHTASRLVCEVRAHNPDFELLDDREGPVCRASGVEYSAVTARPGATSESELQAWVAAVLRKEKLRKPVTSPIPDRMGSRFPEAWLSDGDTYMRLSAGVVDGWVYRERINASAEIWRQAGGPGRAFAPLDRAAPLPAARPAITVLPKPRSSKAKAMAEGPPPTVEAVRGLVAACRPEGAFAERFGATTSAGIASPRIGNSFEVRPSPAIPGVAHVELVVTNTSGKVHSINAWSPPVPDKAELQRLVAAGRAEAERLGWSLTEEPDEDEGATAYVFARGGGGGGRPELELEVGEGLGTVVVTCRDPELYDLTWREVTGEAPIKERPTPPVVPPGPPRLWSADCADSGMRRVILKAVFEENRVRMGLGAQWDRYYEALAHWKVARIAEKAGLTKAQASDLGMRAAVGGMEQGFEANLKSLMEGFEGLGEMEEALEADDEAGACRKAVVWLDATADLVKGNRSQWRGMHGLLDAEARKRGVSLD